MSNPNFPSLTKTCAACGKRKPISSFLVMTDEKGALYGNICGDCQKAEMAKGTEEGSDRSETGRTIDSKARIKSEADKREKIEKERDAEIKESQTQNSDDLKISEKKQTREQSERKIRDASFLNRSSFLNTKNQKETALIAREIELTEQQEQNIAENTKQAEMSKDERQIKNIDTTIASQGTQTGFQEKHRRLFELTSWMGDTPMIRNIKQALGEQSPKDFTQAPEEPKGPSSRGRR